MSCLKSASCLLPYLPEDAERAEYVLSAARKFEDYIINRKGEHCDPKEEGDEEENPFEYVTFYRFTPKK